MIRLDRLFLEHLAADDAGLHARLLAARADPGAMAIKDEAALVVELGRHLEDFVAALFRIENQFGGSFGGRVIKDKTFFFVSLLRWTDRRLGSGTTINGDRNTQVFVGGAKLMLGLSPATSRLGFFISGGPSIIRRGKDVANNDQSTTDWGGVGGLGVRIPFSASVGLRIEAEDYFYGGNFDGSRKFQNDLVLSAGLAIGW